MSLFSRFRKAPPPSAAVKHPEPVAPKAPPEPRAPEAALLAGQEEQGLQAAIAGGDVQTIARLVIEGSSTRIRQQAAEAIDDPGQIRELIRNARGGKDKSVYKILTRKRDSVLAQEREVEHLHAEVAATAAAIEKHSHRPFDPLFTPTLEQLEGRWSAVATHADPEVAEKTRQAIDRAREVIAQHLRQIAVEAARQLAAANAAAQAQLQREQEEKTAAAAAAERAHVQEVEHQAEVEKHEAEAKALRQIGGLIRKAHGALAAGSSKTAAGLRRGIEDKLAHAPHLPAHLANQLRQLDEKLQELKDWKSFSVAPKRIELIERMESLIGATLHPTALAGHIKDLQEQWRTLSKGAGENGEAEWQRFHEAAQKAFQPCREFFEAQDQVKEENLRQRGQLFERLANFESQHNWEQPDWRNVITAVREARQLWRQHSPVDPSAAEQLQGRFNELTASLQNRIDAEYARNVKEKKSLIERARALVGSPETRKAIDEVKRLQEKWKAVGPVSRDDDRKLWEEFRKQCDALFQKRQQEFATQNAALDANKSQALALCEEIEKIAQLSGQELLEGAKKVPELRDAFDAIEELPKADARQLQNRFERAFERGRKAVAQQHARDAEQGWAALLDGSNAVRAYRLAVARNADEAERDTLKQTAESQLASAVKWPKRGLETLKHALAQPGSNDLAANELALRTLCVRAEILTDTPTPDADQTLRREYQVKRLMQSMGQGIKAEEGLDALTLEWLGVGPMEEGTYAQLLERFKACRRKAL
ncbi:hypothetical protein GCM10011487_60990 [Steroidobacter agaridevorans]|uniref:DUF349 domain-containing protein n=1 Tax=Steroidobacter agaridevorans TaxID=2695856 RepID=A0A829YLL9_9GAMM|nr:DUF349 domain-containing protein [Steroidobacter agaridevorans]GFE84099.1 hypothetical protein GCM10011487_60990 [Steroidobacter agaridevorans]